MESKEFVSIRERLNKTQKQTAQLLGTSVKAVQGYEQGWRKIPGHVERQMFFLLSRSRHIGGKTKPCWIVKKCPSARKRQCPAWEFQAGRLCWFINGTFCKGEAQDNWREKMRFCRTCEVLGTIL